jgi:hypothetical protein
MLDEPEPRSIYRTVNSGTSFGDTPFEQHIGLGLSRAMQQIEIQWPAGGKQTLTGLAVDHAYQIREGDARATMRNTKPFAYPLIPAPHIHP